MKSTQITGNESSGADDPLLGVNAKTSWYPAARSWSGGRKRILGSQAFEANYYHVMSRTCGGEVWFDDIEKEALRRVLWRVAEFCGVQLLTYCVMGNHFHVLVAVPHRATWMQRFEGPEGERRLLGHLRTLYSRNYIEQLEAEIREWRRLGMESMVQSKLQSFKRRMGDLSRFVKEVKERFSRWYNRRHGRRGTLWMDRFKSVLVEGSRGKVSSVRTELDALKAMAAYIDLNPVRAELVSNSKDYPFCGYGEACAGEKRAQRGLCRVVGRSAEGWEGKEVEKAYAGLLSGVDWETGQRRSQKQKKTKTAKGGSDSLEKELTLPELLSRRVRAFSEGLALGTKEFVEEVFQANRRFFGAKRKAGARRMPQSRVPFYVARRTRPEWPG